MHLVPCASTHPVPQLYEIADSTDLQASGTMNLSRIQYHANCCYQWVSSEELYVLNLPFVGYGPSFKVLQVEVVASHFQPCSTYWRVKSALHVPVTCWSHGVIIVKYGLSQQEGSGCFIMSKSAGRKRLFCPHCKEYVSKSTLYYHRSLYYFGDTGKNVSGLGHVDWIASLKTLFPRPDNNSFQQREGDAENFHS